MKPTRADLALWNHYKRPRFAAAFDPPDVRPTMRPRRPSIHDAVNAHAGKLPHKRENAYKGTLSLLRLARKNYASPYRSPSLHWQEPPTFREYVLYLARQGDTLERRAYCGRLARRLR